MPIAIGMVDGTIFRLDASIESFTQATPPTAGWVYLDEGERTLKRYINPANIAYVIEVDTGEEEPLAEIFPPITD